MIKVFLAHPDASYRVAYGESQGIDIASVEDKLIEPYSVSVVRTGIHIALPKGTFGFIKERSSIALKKKLMTMAGIIDNSYRGEIKIVLFNTSNEVVKVSKGEFIAQLLVVNVVEPYGNVVEVKSIAELGETLRGEGGFGSSDSKQFS